MGGGDYAEDRIIPDCAHIQTAVQKAVQFAKAASGEERLACPEGQIEKYFG
jgi:hypothetical protein